MSKGGRPRALRYSPERGQRGSRQRLGTFPFLSRKVRQVSWVPGLSQAQSTDKEASRTASAPSAWGCGHEHTQMRPQWSWNPASVPSTEVGWG